ncbi:MAG: porin [Spirochaetes bacterium]|nr:porin [Spirochaetota bacterium]
MKLKSTALMASLTFFAAAVSAAPKKAPPKPAAKPAVTAPAAPVAAAPAAAPAAEEAPEGLYLKQIKLGKGFEKDIYLKMGGYVDAYYAYHFSSGADTRAAAPYDGYAGGNLGTSTASTGRVFESAGQQFSLGLIQTKFEVGNEDWQVVADLVHGPNAEQTNFNNFRGGATGPTSTTSTAIKQAYISAKLIDNLKITAGQFGTHIGYEVVESYQNPNYMLGYLFGYGPFYHTGVKLDYTLFGGKVGLMGGVVNGWDLQYDNNKDKTIIGQISLKPTSSFSVFINYAGGNESGTNGVGATGGMRHIGDLVVQYQVTKMIKVGINVVYGEDKKDTNTAAATWGGAAGYLTVAPTDWLSFSYRADYYDDRKGARGLLAVKDSTGAVIANNKVLGHTLTTTIAMYGGHFLIRPEVKYDLAENAIFGAGAAQKNNVTALIAFTGVY